jgi:hypothetical protein
MGVFTDEPKKRQTKVILFELRFVCICIFNLKIRVLVPEGKSDSLPKRQTVLSGLGKYLPQSIFHTAARVIS